MRKIDVTSYKLKVHTPEGDKEIDYDTKTFLIAALLHPQLRLTGKDVLERGPLMNKIEQCDGTLLVEEADYLKLKQAFETVQGFTINDMTLVKRVLEAKKVEIEEKKKVKEKN